MQVSQRDITLVVIDSLKLGLREVLHRVLSSRLVSETLLVLHRDLLLDLSGGLDLRGTTLRPNILIVIAHV